MENTKQTPQEKSTLSNILEQIKIVLVIYGIVIIIHMVSIGSKLPDLAKSTVVSFVMVVIAITLKNVVKKPNLPGFAWATLVSFVLTLPISPIADFIVNAMSAYSFGLVGLPLLAFAGIAVGDQLEVFKKTQLENRNCILCGYGIYLFWISSNFKYYLIFKRNDLKPYR